jgi:Mg2+-importing ATPase
LLASLSIGTVVVGLIITLSPLGSLFGFVTPPSGFFPFLIATVAAYLLLVEMVKRVYYARAPGSA